MRGEVLKRITEERSRITGSDGHKSKQRGVYYL
jgi:hypothetical protein